MNPTMALYRLGNRLYRWRFRRLSKLVTWTNRFLFSTFTPSSATIGRDVILGKWGLGIVIHDHAVIGDQCLIRHNVTIGRKEGDVGVPVLGNGVSVGAGAVIMGEIHIGDDCIIGANSFVNSSFGRGSVIVGVPGRCVRTTAKGGNGEP